MRSKWKGKFIKRKIFEKMNNNVKIYSRDINLFKNFLGMRFRIYNGLRLVSMLIKRSMLYYKLGVFVVTKKMGSSIHLNKRKKKKK